MLYSIICLRIYQGVYNTFPIIHLSDLYDYHVKYYYKIYCAKTVIKQLLLKQYKHTVKHININA